MKDFYQKIISSNQFLIFFKTIFNIYHKLKLKSMVMAFLLFSFSNHSLLSAQTFAEPVIGAFNLTSGQLGNKIPNLVDIDGDGDLDLFESFVNTNVNQSVLFLYQKNLGTASNPEFDIIPDQNVFNLGTDTILNPGTNDFDFADLDNDGDYDILITDISSQGSIFLFYENIGTTSNPIFDSPEINPFGLDSIENIFLLPTFVDLDNDGDFDIMCTTDYGNFLYYKNTGTSSNPSYGSPQPNPFGLEPLDYYTFLTFPDFADLDGDGDLDMIGYNNYNYESTLVYRENIGTVVTPNFSDEETNTPLDYTIPVGATGLLECADLDNDGDVDVILNLYEVTPNYDGAETLYFENLGNMTSTSTIDNDLSMIAFPNPTEDFLNVSGDVFVDSKYINLDIYNSNGALISQNTQFNFGQKLNLTIDISHLNRGHYTIKLEIDNEYKAVSFIKQ